MVKITEEDILKLARLSRLQLTEEETERFAKEVEAILGYAEQLQSVDLSGVEPTSQVTGLKNVMRRDEVVDYGVDAKALLKNAPNKEDDHIKVKRILA